MTRPTLVRIDDPGTDDSRHIALLSLGFRPFYLLASAFAALAVPLWLLSLFHGPVRFANINLLWHMHEMVFGFAAAVVVGFLFTAARNWTGLQTPRQGWLALFIGFWLAGRLAMLLAPPAWAALCDIIFLPSAMVPLYEVLRRSGNRRNMPLLGLLALLTIFNLAYHAAMLGWSSWPAMRAVEAAILVLTMLSTIMGGRVIPGFTRNMAPKSKPETNLNRDRVGFGLMAIASIAWLCEANAALTTLLCTSAGVIHLYRLWRWQPQHTVRYPMLWVLHLAYAWIGVGFILLGAAAIGYGSNSSALHALAIGGMSTLIVGMVTRTALGHTGRPIRAGRAEHLIFCAISLAAIFRLAANLMPHAYTQVLLCIAAACWILTFFSYLVVYGPYLCKPRH